MSKPAHRQSQRNKSVEQFAADVLESIRQMKRGEVAQVHTPDDIILRCGQFASKLESFTKPHSRLI